MSNTESMAKRVTAAMAKELWRQAEDSAEYVNIEYLDAVDIDGTFDLVAVVKVAIEAMREPSDSVIDAALKEGSNE